MLIVQESHILHLWFPTSTVFLNNQLISDYKQIRKILFIYLNLLQSLNKIWQK